MRRSLHWLRSQSGASAVEFALVVPVLMSLTLAILNFCGLLYAQTALHYTVDSLARYCAVNSSACTSATAASAYAPMGTKIFGVTYSLTLRTPTSTTPGVCRQSASTGSAMPGYVLTASGTYNFNVVLKSFSIPVQATACYPQIT